MRPRSPARTPRHVRWETALALPFGSAVLGAAGARLVAPESPSVGWLLAPMLALVGLIAATRDPREPEEDAPVIWTALGGALFAVPAAFSATTDRWIGEALLAATPCGLALYGVWLVLLGRLRGLADGPTLEDPALAKLHAGRWLTAVALGGGVVTLGAPDRFTTLVSLAAGVVGVARWTAGAIGRRERRRLLDAVRRGEIDGWCTVDPRAVSAPASLPRWSRTEPLTEVLLQVSADDSCRVPHGGLARALVPPARGRSTPVRWCAPSLLSRGSAALVAAVFAPFVGVALGALAASLHAHASSAEITSTVVAWTPPAARRGARPSAPPVQSGQRGGSIRTIPSTVRGELPSALLLAIR